MSVYIRTCTILSCQSGKEKPPSANFQLVTIEEMECKFGCHERENLQRSFANEHWTEAKTKSDSQVQSLMSVAEFKTNNY